MPTRQQIIKAARGDKGWTQQQLAEESDLSLDTVNRAEAEGEQACELAPQSLAKIAKPLGLKTLDLVAAPWRDTSPEPSVQNPGAITSCA